MHLLKMVEKVLNEVGIVGFNEEERLAVFEDAILHDADEFKFKHD